ncbi:MAG: leucine-rich repeat domain-containing protein, partial [Bacteroidales bacterium]|nr:leucine-rich repeat domain-containing protein [Bacteroidales bacterium]
MKRLLFILMCFSAIFAGRAQTFSVGDLTYTVTDAVKLEVSVKANSKSIEGEVIIPESVTYMSEQYSVTSIGSRAFEDCTSLTSIIIPNSVTSIGWAAFGNCIRLTAITIPNSVTSIDGFAFNYCTGLTSITIPNSVTSISECAFNGCRGMTNIEVDEKNRQYCSVDGVLFNKDKTLLHTFPAGSKLSEYIIPNSVTSIGPSAFGGCSGLTSITIPNSVTSIGQEAFLNCVGLTSITIPNSVTSIGPSAFGNCTGLTSISIPNSVTSIEYRTFEDCMSLTSITIPNSVTSIGEYTFCYSGIRNISINNPEPPTVRGSIFDTSKEITVSVPTNLVETYKAAKGWKDLNIVGVVPKNLSNGSSTTALDFDANTFAGIQFDVECPAGVELSVCEEAAAQMTISKSEIPGGKTRYIAYTNNGEALTSEFIVTATATEAERGTLKISNIITSVNDVPVGISDV